MNARLVINLATGVIEAEGPPDFVAKVYADLRDTIVNRSSKVPLSSPLGQAPAADDQGEDEDGAGKGKKVRRRGKPTGPSCASRIQALGEGYFAELRSGGDVRDKLSEKGTAYEAKNVAAALIDLVRRGALRRVKQNGSWMYQNP